MSLYLCLYVCLFAVIKTRASNFPELLMMMPMARSTASQVGQIGRRICSPSRIIQLLRQECYTE